MNYGTEAYLGHWQPAFRPNDYQSLIPSSSAFEHPKPSDSLLSQLELSEPPEPSAPIMPGVQVPPPVPEPLDPTQHYDDRPQQTTGLPPVGTSASQKEASKVSDVSAYIGRSGQVEDVSEPTPNASEQTGPRGVDDTVVLNSGHQEKVTSKSDEESAQFGLSLPLRTRQEDDNNGSELSSDDDEERLDPAWGIKRMDTSQVLAQVQRSPSFPDFVSQREKLTVEPPAPLAMTQSERSLQEVEDITGGYSPFAQESGAKSARVEQPLDDAGAGTGRTVMPDQPLNVESKETRFEEGVPLIQEEPDVQAGAPSPATRPAADGLFDISEETDDASFFGNHTQDGIGTHQPPSLDRKATADVLQSLHFSATDGPDSPAEGSRNFLESAEDNNWFASDDTFEPIKDKENDISEMWKAALDDDEFLVEDPDDLLPDSASDSPSSFLESLKAEDTNAQEPEDSHPPSNTQSSPGLASFATNQPSIHATYQSSQPLYAPHQPSTSDMTQSSPTTLGNVGISRPGISSMNSMQQQLQRAAPPKAESFVDQAKGGYKSPYDLPLELSKPRKRPQVQAPAPPSSMPPPPPRSSSMTSEKPPIPSPAQLQSPFSPTNASFSPHLRSSSSQIASALPPKAPPAAATQAPVARPASTSFFEELPLASRPRPPTGQGRYTPQQNSPVAPPQMLPQSPTSAIHQPPPRSLPPSHPPPDPYAQYQLQRPERLDPYANVPLQPPPAPVNVATRYSPAPAASQVGARPTPSPRYSPAPPAQLSNAPPAHRYASQPAGTTQPPQSRPSPPNRYVSQPASTAPAAATAHAFQPRTSSPLAHFGRSADPQPTEAFPPSVGNDDASASISTRNVERYQSAIMDQPPPSQFQPSGAAPAPGEAALFDSGFQPPRRSQTQSPSKRVPISRLAMANQDNMQRPASVHGQTSPVRTSNPYEFAPPPRTSVRQRGLSQHLDFIPPTGEERHDELKRWKGSPIFRFGFGGSAVSSFPKHVPRYGAGSSVPLIKPTAGEIHIKSVKDISPLQDQVAKFPGPLRSKSKKKDVLNWLSARIAAFEEDENHIASQTQLTDPHKRNGEKILLWKIVQTMVEHDGALDGPAGVQKDINLILSPEVHVLDDASATQYAAGSDLTGIYRPADSAAKSEPVDPVAVDTLRKSLLRGEREKAMWHAVDNRLWAHALLIASTLDRSKWREVVQEFVRREVKIMGTNTESLAALYEVFAGNLDESIDELVPPSARAGLQMVSKVNSTGPTRNALDGLDRWRETLSLILNNRSAEDHQALAALGGLLARYGRIEASHICYLFSRTSGRSPIFAGVDDPNATIVLLGADHWSQPSNFSQDEDAILLTEVYEFATSVLSANSQSASIPHLQAYKLQRALVLAETGYTTESQAYCDAISAISKSTTKTSPYYGPQLFEMLEELSRRLKQTPTDSSSWIAKPSIEKVSGSVWNKFHSFVAGDESDAESRGSGKDAAFEAGPFANVSSTPSLSRSGSTTDLYGSSLASATQGIPSTIASSRYAPTSQQFARYSPEALRARSSLDSQRSPPFSNPTQSHPLHDQASSFGPQSYLPTAGSVYQPSGQSPPSNRYQSTPPQTSYIPNGSHENSPSRPYRPQRHESYVPTPPLEESVPSYLPTPPQHPNQESTEAKSDPMPTFGGFTPSPQPEYQQPLAQSIEDDHTTQPPTQSYGYEPPSDTGYVPYEPDPDSNDEKQPDLPQKKSIMDNDEDDFPHAAASSPSVSNPTDDAAAKRRAADVAADEAFRKAAEEDAKKDKDKAAKSKGSWFGGWLGKKDESLDSAGEKKVIKAKLGETSSFYYDENLKRWVNKKDPSSAQAGAKAAPPPPKGPVGAVRGLMPSASLPNLNGAPPRTRTPDENGSIPPPALNGSPKADLTGPPTSARPPLDAGATPIGGPGLGLVPPPRPSTASSNASSIDDLLAPPAAGGRRSVRGSKKPKGGRYVDLVAAKQEGET
jgi:COPII coat assembly protein SEC16